MFYFDFFILKMATEVNDELYCDLMLESLDIDEDIEVQIEKVFLNTGEEEEIIITEDVIGDIDDEENNGLDCIPKVVFVDENEIVQLAIKSNVTTKETVGTVGKKQPKRAKINQSFNYKCCYCQKKGFKILKNKNKHETLCTHNPKKWYKRAFR